MANQIDPDCSAGVDCEGCSCEVYCPPRDTEQKRRQVWATRAATEYAEEFEPDVLGEPVY